MRESADGEREPRPAPESGPRLSPITIAPRPPIRKPRLGSRSEAVRSWVLGLEPLTVFWLSDMPADLQPYASRVLHDMTREYIDIRRLCKGFYRRGPLPWETGIPSRDGSTGHCGIAYAGAGSGYGGFSAVNQLGWTTQVPALAEVSVVGRCPEASMHAVDFVSSSNELRRTLTWAEVTLIEATLNAFLAEPPADYCMGEVRPELGWGAAAWREAMRRLAEGWSLLCLGHGAVLRGPRLAEVAVAEPRRPEGFLERMEEVVRLVGERSEHPDPTPPVRYVNEPVAGDPFTAAPRPYEGRHDARRGAGSYSGALAEVQCDRLGFRRQS